MSHQGQPSRRPPVGAVPRDGSRWGPRSQGRPPTTRCTDDLAGAAVAAPLRPCGAKGEGCEGGEAWRKRRAAVASAGPLTPAAVTLAAARVGRGRERRGEREREREGEEKLENIFFTVLYNI